ncbi:MAG: hypothetical protein DHS20C11_17130 [Lysobacteraceae bacterium]|nr:MAG: hypothetical protein DHS20C11_17130 [Xanthomonadaceae bacterium]
MKITLHIHAGSGKTGTSAIQYFLRNNRQEMLRQGYAYAGTFFEEFSDDQKGNLTEVFSRAKKKGVQFLTSHIRQCLARITKRYSDHPIRHIIWSNEGILTSHAVMGEVLSNLVTDYDVHFVAYLRRQDEWLSSAYRQWGIRHKTNPGPVMEFDQWMVRYQRNANYDALLGQWEKSIGLSSITARIYEKCHDVVVDFAAVVGLNLSVLDIPDERAYKTPDATILSLFKLYNTQFDEQIHPRSLVQLLDKAGILARHIRPTNITATLPGVDKKRQLLAQYEPGNKRLSRFSKPDYDVSFPTDEPTEVGSHDVTTDQILSALLLMLVDTDRRSSEAQRRIAELEKRVARLAKQKTMSSPGNEDDETQLEGYGSKQGN